MKGRCGKESEDEVRCGKESGDDRNVWEGEWG